MAVGPDHSIDHVAVIGGGVIGLCTAYYLRAAGIEVTILERDRVGSGASRGNAGEVCPGLSAPLPAPGVVRASLRTLHRRDSALYMRPQPSMALTRSLLDFAWSTRERAFARGVAALGALSRDAVEQYREMESRDVQPRINARPYIHAFASHERDPGGAAAPAAVVERLGPRRRGRGARGARCRRAVPDRAGRRRLTRRWSGHGRTRIARNRTREWVGPRPMTANGLPRIDALDEHRRVFVAAGHNMLGVTLAPGTGRAVAELATGGSADVDLSPFALGGTGRRAAPPVTSWEAAG